MIRFPLLLPAIVLAPAAAVESWGVPDFSQRDKQEHAIGGFVVGAAVDALAHHAHWRPWQRIVAGVAASALIGIAKEASDHRCPHTHDCDPKDALATVAGGAAGVLTIECVWRF